MKQILLLITALVLTASINGQTYHPFPKDSAQWHNLFWHQWSPSDIHLTNTTYFLQGDTLINGEAFSKMFYFETDNLSAGTRYIGGLREDSLKNIYFFPVSKNLPTIEPISFPNDTTEHLIYTFSNLDSGMVIPINTNNTSIKVVGVDSILLGSEYRKRYEVQNFSFLSGPEYWIEGIGSSKQLFSAYTYEFEWNYYTLCYTDSVTYYINSPNGEDSCHYQIPLSLNEHKKTITFEVYPNPASESIFVDVENKNGVINVYNISGNALINNMEVNSELKIDLTAIEPGIYFIEFISDNHKAYKKFIKI